MVKEEVYLAEGPGPFIRKGRKEVELCSRTPVYANYDQNPDNL